MAKPDRAKSAMAKRSSREQKIAGPLINYRLLTYAHMAEIVQGIRVEIKERNPIMINAYTPYLDAAVDALTEISNGEAGNFTSEKGPREPKRRKTRTR